MANRPTFEQESVLFGLRTATALTESATTPAVAQFTGKSVDATGKALRRLREKGYVVAKVKGPRSKPTQRRYEWRLSARGFKALA